MLPIKLFRELSGLGLELVDLGDLRLAALLDLLEVVEHGGNGGGPVLQLAD